MDTSKFSFKKFLKRFAQEKMAVLALIIFTFIVIITVAAPLFTPFDPEKIDFYSIELSPSSVHILGTDSSGRDIFARIIYGGRISIIIAFTSMLIQLCIGVTLGVIVGYYGGFLDMTVARIIDIIMCFPFFILALTITLLFGAGQLNLIMIIGFLMWPNIAKIVRTNTLVLKNNEYVLSAKALGLNDFEIIVRHILPSLLPAILVASVLAVATGIVMEASLSFLGLGVVSIPSWGNMLSVTENFLVLEQKWWLWAPAGVIIIVTVLSINYIAKGLQSAFNIKSGTL